MEQNRFEERLAALERRLTALDDREQIQNLMAKHNFLFSAGQGRRIVPELWSSSDEASIEYGASGVYRRDKAHKRRSGTGLCKVRDHKS